MTFQLYLDPETPPTAEESKQVKETLQICGSPKRAVLALLRLTHSLAYDLSISPSLLGKEGSGNVHYAAPSKDIEWGAHTYSDKPQTAPKGGAH